MRSTQPLLPIRHRHLPAALALALLAGAAGLAAGCRQDAAEERSEIREDLEEKGPSAVAGEAARTADFTPPEDGKLTGDQIDMYLDVRKREKDILAVAAEDLETRDVPPAEGSAPGSETGGQAPRQQPQQAAGAAGQGTEVTVEEVTAPPREVAQIATADVRAAQDLGKDPLEYQWVKGQILQAQMALYTGDWAKLEESGREKMIEGLRRMQDAAGTPAEEGEIERKIDELRDPEATRQEETEGLRHNMQLVRERQREILALERWPEMAGTPAGAATGAAPSPGR